MATDLGAVMDAIGTALATISGLNVFDYPPDQAVPPFAFVDMPQQLDFDLTASRGWDRALIPVHVGVGTSVARDTRDALCAYVASGSIKAVLDAIGPNYRVQSVTFGTIGLAGGSYPGAVFLVDVVA